MDQLTIDPPDQHNRRLAENVHPSGWANPTPRGRYNLVVIGAGTAGLVSAAAAAGLGAKVALIERDWMGGDCLNFGCVPSKALIRAARAAAEIRDGARFGVKTKGVTVDFAEVMERVRRVRADLSKNDSAARLRGLGVDVFFGEAHLCARDQVEVGGQKLRFSKAVIATGARANAPPIPGLEESGYLTNETVFSLTALPQRLAVIGAGPIGCELAQALRRLGADVNMLEAMPQILVREDRDAAERVAEVLSREGIKLIAGCDIKQVRLCGGVRTISFERQGARNEIVADQIIIGAGRAPNVAALNLEAAGVAYDDRNGVRVNDYLQTTNPRIYAAGDVCSAYRFTHMADAMARIVIRNALFAGRRRLSALTIPWCTYTDPEIAHTGLYEDEARARGIPVITLMQDLSEVDRAVLDGQTDGLVKIHVRKGSGRIVGATVVAAHASEIISELTVAISGRIGLSKLAEIIHPYPTQAEAIRKVADSWNRSRLTPFLQNAFRRWLAWQR
jgi:pyruvate/2-oxoglutarate dehydrogenase complex dihydrolipoamide dehydrogenase (E3) component